MAMVWAVILMSGVLSTSAQHIYPKENSRCVSNGETMMQIRELVIQQGGIKESVDSLRRMLRRLKDDVTSTVDSLRRMVEGLEDDGTRSDVMHQLTKGKNSSLYVSITLRNGTTLYEQFQEFSVADEINKDRLYLGGPATETLGSTLYGLLQHHMWDQVADLIAAGCMQKYTCLTRQYKIVIDKGTYDAISLIPDSEVEARQAYLKTVKHLVDEDRIFVITSCNWTKEQLLQFFKPEFELFEKIPTPSFQFGGQMGSTVTSLVKVYIQVFLTFA
ncbi:uncharacterized protein LOC134283224 [Saccostrea cucullata]|uniref:uncharacterized protein LOC134283224 n=1 Tax=Saccostrea cuccullata TaxID=36930 RepID=UPI002ED2DC40